jgi:DNA-binding winged helix-turn-helix (wHTH) protein
MNQAVRGVLSFNRFSLDLTRGYLRAGEQDIELRPKAFEVLRYLAENAGRLVAKEELHEAVWPNVTVSDGSIVQCIRELRSKLGDVDHRLIKTVSRRGYLLDVTDSAGAPQRLRDGLAVLPPEAPQTQLGSQQRVSAIPAHKLDMWTAVAAVLLSAAWWVTYLPGRDATKLAAQPKLEKPQTAGQFDGVWRVEFSNNDFCVEKHRTGFWIVRQGVLKSGGAGTTRGTVSGTGELRVTWPALVDPTLTSAGSAKLQGDRGEGRWDGQRRCSGTLTLTRLSGS